MIRSLIIILGIVISLGVTSCEKKSKAEKMLQKAADKTEEVAEEGADKTEKAANKTEKKIKKLFK